MTVKELIKELRKLPQNKEVQIWGTIDDDGKGQIKIDTGEEVRNY